jgi:hypothetical protein
MAGIARAECCAAAGDERAVLRSTFAGWDLAVPLVNDWSYISWRQAEQL